ncbi:MAG: hypothetical protein A3D57_00515 [Candidatus Sungbacteria bacterium RIFCSPHIGHO2_02_FULL_46_12]|nr:MAG: hypothetical protein A3D57_00515 [Candidatus Sungbacteria bacterium RIFCSPHIGHO2_02_FULL_46_12]
MPFTFSTPIIASWLPLSIAPASSHSQQWYIKTTPLCGAVFRLGHTVKDVRTMFEEENKYVYIPNLKLVEVQ